MPEPTSGKVVVSKDTTVSLECKANGNPTPSVSWTKMSFSHHTSNRNEKVGENQQIQISKITRLHKPGNFYNTLLTKQRSQSGRISKLYPT